MNIAEEQMKLLEKVEQNPNAENFQSSGVKPGDSYHIITYGCQMNKNDSERAAGLLENIGYQYESNPRLADIVMLNTCSIRDKAERRVSGKFHELNHSRKETGFPKKLGIMGCMPQHAKRFIRERLPFIDFVVGVNNFEDLPNVIQNPLSLQKQIEKMKKKRSMGEVKEFELNLSHQVRAVGEKAWVSIQFGCNKMCSYCIVPFTRGREISRTKENIFKEIESLAGKGVRQIVLLGQNVNSYGLTTYENYDFSHLLEDIAVKFPWLGKIDFLTSYPSDVTERLVEVIANHKNITKEIHFPLQHGDDEILDAMKRHYTVDDYRQKVAMLREKMPNVRLGTDLIVAFPGETEQHFTNMLEVLSEIQFDFANTAVYSPRPLTPAARMEGQISKEEGLSRLHRINAHLQHIYERKNMQQTI